MALLTTQQTENILFAMFKQFIVFTDVPDMDRFKISDLVAQLARNDAPDWAASLDAFVQHIILVFENAGYELLDFDTSWFDTNKDKTIAELVEYLRVNSAEI